MKREVPIAIAFVSGLVMMAAYYCPRLDALSDTFQNWFTIVQAFAFILGAGSLLMVNTHRILRQQSGWGYNLVLLASFFVTLIAGTWKGTGSGTPFYWIFQNVYTPLAATMYSLLAFFIASAAFRAFKAKTVEATLLLVTACIVMLFRMPVGELLWNQLGLNHVMSVNTLIDRWIMGTFTTAAQRAILLGATVGLISISLKLMLGIERSYLGGD